MFDPLKLFTWAENNINVLSWYNSDADRIAIYNTNTQYQYIVASYYTLV